MKHRPALHSDTTTLGFQIAPMIDVVFVILLFFMVMVATVKVERQIGLQLPRPCLPGAKVRFPDNEVTLGVLEDGTVTMNEEEFGTPADKALPALTLTLRRLATSSKQQGQSVLATIQAEELASYERVMDVLNSLSKAEIKNVTFTVGIQPL